VMLVMGNLPASGGRVLDRAAINPSSEAECCGAAGRIIGWCLLCCQSPPPLTHEHARKFLNLCLEIICSSVSRHCGSVSEASRTGPGIVLGSTDQGRSAELLGLSGALASDVSPVPGYGREPVGNGHAAAGFSAAPPR